MSEQDFGAECAEAIRALGDQKMFMCHERTCLSCAKTQSNVAKIINDQLARRQPAPEPEEPSERMFGTHIREAIEAFKPLFRKDDPQPAPENGDTTECSPREMAEEERDEWLRCC